MMERHEIIRSNPILMKAFSFVVKNNTSNLAPYHNTHHLLTVLKYADYLAQQELIPYDDRLTIHLAALFHDMNHSQGKEKDDAVNIKIAKDAFNVFYADIVKTTSVSGIGAEVERLIDVTQFKYVKPSSQLTDIKEMIMRDADMMQQFEPNWITQVSLGLAEEAGMSFHEFIPMQRGFLENLKFITESGKKFKKENWPRVLDQFRVMEKIADEC